MQSIEEMFSGFIDTWLCSLLTNSEVNLAQEYGSSIKQRLAEQFESLSRIPFISSGKLFKSFFEFEMTNMSANVSEENSFDKAFLAHELAQRGGNPFASDRRLTESVPPKNQRFTLVRDQPQPVGTFDYSEKDDAN
mmetsp:Transcript_7205/g.8649  ORF Transcript_7205/g.8649 Transcript_7205/m.8649 type:complete len:136 (+) Transcript_7205:652-1059(+)